MLAVGASGLLLARYLALWGWMRCVRSASAAQEDRGVHGRDEGHETVFLPQGRVPSALRQPIVAATCVTAAPHGVPVDLRTVIEAING